MIKKELLPKLINTALGAFGFGGTVIGILTVQGTVELPWRLIILIGIITFVCICVAVMTIIETKHWTEQGVRYPIQSIKTNKTSTIVYTEYTETLPVNALATINYENDRKNERLGLAVVTNYSSASEYNYVELEVKYVFPSHNSVYNEAIKERKKVLDKISIKPAVRVEDYEAYMKYRREEKDSGQTTK